MDMELNPFKFLFFFFGFYNSALTELDWNLILLLSTSSQLLAQFQD